MTSMKAGQSIPEAQRANYTVVFTATKSFAFACHRACCFARGSFKFFSSPRTFVRPRNTRERALRSYYTFSPPYHSMQSFNFFLVGRKKLIETPFCVSLCQECFGLKYGLKKKRVKAMYCLPLVLFVTLWVFFCVRENLTTSEKKGT